MAGIAAEMHQRVYYISCKRQASMTVYAFSLRQVLRSSLLCIR